MQEAVVSSPSTTPRPESFSVSPSADARGTLSLTDTASCVIPTYRIWTDGGIRGNPGPAASAFVAYRPNGHRYTDVSYNPFMTNNEAEYVAVIESLKWLINSEETLIKYEDKELRVEIRSDSQLLVRQVTGVYVCNAPKLRPLCDEAVGYYELLKESLGFNHVQLIHVPREENKEADRICAEFLDAQSQIKRKMK